MLLEICVLISPSYRLLAGFKQKPPTVKVIKRINSEETRERRNQGHLSEMSLIIYSRQLGEELG